MNPLKMIMMNFLPFIECPRPAGWCVHTGSSYNKKDCDGDGILDPTCLGRQGRKFGILSSLGGCKDTWPSGTCNGG